MSGLALTLKIDDMGRKIGIILLILLVSCFFSQAQECTSGNCYDGFGKIVYDNGQEYVGEFKNGVSHGYGQTWFNGGAVYIGEYNNGERHGFGVFDWKNGNRFIGKFKNGKEDGYALKFEKNGGAVTGTSRILTSKWRDGELEIGSVEEIGSKTGCLRGKCDKSSENGIYVSQNRFVFGNTNKAILITKNDYRNSLFSNIYIGETSGYLGKNFAIKKGFTAIKKTKVTEYLELKNKKNGVWTSYFYFQKDIYIRNWIDDEIVDEIPIDDIDMKISAPASLVVENVLFNDYNSNNLLEANEEATISFNLKNTGKGPAYGINIQITDNNNIRGINYDRNIPINILKPQGINVITIDLSTSMKLATGTSSFNITISERNGFDADPVNLSVSTQSFIPPQIEIVDFVFSSDVGKMELGKEVNLQFAIQNTGQGIGEDINIEMLIPNNVFDVDGTEYSIIKLNPGAKKIFDFSFFTNKRFVGDTLKITADISEKFDKYAINKIMSVKMEEDISKDIALDIESDVIIEDVAIKRFSLTSLVDKNIPESKKVSNRFALVIGNEDYKSFQRTLTDEQNVDYAENDATVFKQYCLRTLGVKEENMHFILNATAGQMSQEIDLISKILSKLGDQAELIVYYAGHGYSDEVTKVPYLIPVDVSVANLSNGVKLSDVYSKLSKTNASKISIFLDACFTGGGRNLGLLASRGVRVRPKEGSLSGNLVVFSASSGEQSSLPYYEEGHGMFTYYLLKKLQESQGNINFGELSDYLTEKVSYESLIKNKVEQDPITSFSQKVAEEWRKWRF
ncbi:caspase family protein [Cyclobacteriaceae bacterium]|nr:caspase family protein [Cyclobacteriaceae bacterium]